MTLIEIFIILFVHFIADFVVQTDYQAKNKSSSNKQLLLHISSYTSIWFLVIPFMFFNWNLYEWKGNWFLFLVITFTLHFITDYITSRINKYLWGKGDVHGFFVSVGFDQFLHYLQLFLTYKLLTS